MVASYLSWAALGQVFSPVSTPTPNPLITRRQQALRAALSPLPNTNGTVIATWDDGAIPNTLSNLTIGAAIDAGTNHLLVVGGLLVGSTNTFIVTDALGKQSNIASGVAQVFTNKVRIVTHTFMVSWEVVPGMTNTLWRNYDLQNQSWTRIVSFIGTNGTCSVVQTNSGRSGFWMVTLQ